ncbi:MAG: hypothetical protein IKF41_02820 [Alphaproteobacteria bacterium]|nr:hypothetical protein [Alphaproteobacteria bacterium]
MGNFLKTQNIFSFGEVSPEFYAINNNNGLTCLENMDVLQSGALKRRPGLKQIDEIPDDAIIVPFKISESEKYLLVIYGRIIDIYENDEKIESLSADWADLDLKQLQYAQRFNKIFFVHPDFKPQILTKEASGFHIEEFVFHINTDVTVNVPFMRFDDMNGVSITITNSDIDNNHAVFTADKDIWANDWLWERLLINGKQWLVESVQSARVAIVYTNGTFTCPGHAISDWYVGAFSNKRGWPRAVSFHQNRLVFGGTKSAPNNIWMSKVGDYDNFDSGEGLDDDAIFMTLLSSQHHQISTIVSSDNLQILTSVGEWAISNSPLTPSNVNIKQHTSVGSITNIYLPPQQIEGATVFVSQSGKDVRELDLDDLSQKYNANDLCSWAKHLMRNPISIAFNQLTHQLFIVMSDGYMAVLNKHPNTDIRAWGKYITDGAFKYVAVFDNNTYVIVKRDNKYYLEKFDTEHLIDAQTYKFTYKISALPMIVNGHNPKKIRARKVSLRVKDTKTVFINNYRVEIPNSVYEANALGYDGDLSMNLLGSQINTMEPLWTVSSDEQLGATILSVTVDGWYLI